MLPRIGEMVSKLTSARAPRALRVHAEVDVRASTARAFDAIRYQERLPRFVPQLATVTPLGEDRYRWTVAAENEGEEGPSWDVEITGIVPGRLVTWRSVKGADFAIMGEALFIPLAPGTTRVSVHITYALPSGAAGRRLLARLGPDPEAVLAADLERLGALLSVDPQERPPVTPGPGDPWVEDEASPRSTPLFV